jgi:hypothetical protein
MHAGAQVANIRVIDGDDVEVVGRRYRLAGYDTPEIEKPRSTFNPVLERRRGAQAKLRLETLIGSVKAVHLIPWKTAVSAGDRELAVLLVNGWDVATVAQRERWGISYDKRAEIDWGNPSQPFADHLPVPEAGGLPPDPFFDDDMARRLDGLSMEILQRIDLDAPDLAEARNSFERELGHKGKAQTADPDLPRMIRHGMHRNRRYADLLTEFTDAGKAAKGALLKFLARSTAAHSSRSSAIRQSARET